MDDIDDDSIVPVMATTVFMPMAHGASCNLARFCRMGYGCRRVVIWLCALKQCPCDVRVLIWLYMRVVRLQIRPTVLYDCSGCAYDVTECAHDIP